MSEPSYDQALRLPMFHAGLAGATRTNEYVDTLIAYLSSIVDTEQHKLNLRILFLEVWNGAQEHSTTERGAHAYSELPRPPCICLEATDSFVESYQHLGCMTVEPRTVGRKLHNTCGPAEEEDAEAVFKAADRSADRRGVDQEAAGSRNKASSVGNADEDLDHSHTRAHHMSYHL